MLVVGNANHLKWPRPSKSKQTSTQFFLKKYWNELVKKSMGTRQGWYVFTNDHIHKPHPHTYPQRPQLSHKMRESHAFLSCFRKDLTVSCKIYKPTSVYYKSHAIWWKITIFNWPLTLFSKNRLRSLYPYIWCLEKLSIRVGVLQHCKCTQTDSVPFNTNYIPHVGICMQVWLVDVGHVVVCEHIPSLPCLHTFFTSSSLYFL